MSEDPLLGRVLADRFEIESLVGRGGMARGYVYWVRDTVGCATRSWTGW